MRFILSDARLLAGALALPLMLSACGGGNEAANSSAVHMKDLETVDGTINDAMTDLDGVQTEGTAMADVGNTVGSSSGNASAPADKPTDAAASDASADEEVVADQ